MAQPFLDILRGPRSISDFTRAKEEFDANKRLREQQLQMGEIELQKAMRPDIDIENVAKKEIFDFYRGKPLSEEGKAAISTLAAMQGNKTEYKPDALGRLQAQTTENPYSQFLQGVDGGQYKPMKTPRDLVNSVNDFTPDYSNMPALEDYSLDNSPQAIANALGVSVDDIRAAQSSPETMFPKIKGSPDRPVLDDTARYNMVTEDTGIDINSPLYRAKITEEAAKNAGLQTAEATKAAIGVAAKGDEVTATKLAEYEAAKPKKLDAISRIEGNMAVAEKELENLPRGLIQAGAGYLASGVAGFPTKMSKAEAVIDRLLPSMVQDMKQVVREAGEGTFTDTDQKAVEGMFFDKAAPLEAKLAGYDTIIGMLNRYKQSLGQKAAQPVNVEDLIRKYSQ